MGKKNELPITEDLDFHYLLTLLPPLKGIDEYACLPELYSCVGYERLIKLCTHAGGETIRIPTIPELIDAMEALQYFYDIDIKKLRTDAEIPDQYRVLVEKIRQVYYA